MSYFFGDGFDLYSALTDCGTYWDASFGANVTLAISATGRFAGSRGLVIATNANVPYITKTSSVNDAIHHFSIAFYQTAALSGTSDGIYIELFDGATAQCTIDFRSDGAIVLRSGNVLGTALATYTGAVSAINTWYQFEIEVAISNTAGYMNVRKNGNTSNDFASAMNLNTRNSTNNYANKVGLGSQWSTTGQNIDDFLWRSDAASVPWIGDVRCFTRMPVSDSAVAWSRSSTPVTFTPIGTNTTLGVTANNARYTPFTPSYSGTIGTATIGFAVSATANFKCAIYASAGGVPTTVLGSANILTNPTGGSNTLTFPSPVAVTKGTSYFIAVVSDTTSGQLNINSSTSSGLSGSTAYASFPATNPTTANDYAVGFTITIGIVTNYGEVSEAQQDAAASYVYSSTVSQSDLYGIAAIGSTPSTVVGVTTRAYCQKSDAGTRNVAVQLQSGATNVQSASTALNTSWGWIARNDLVDPATGAAWTATGVNNCNIGVVVTA